MKWFLDLRVGVKLALGFGVCLALALVAGGAAMQKMSLMNSNTSSISGESITGIVSMAKFLNDQKEYRIKLLKFVITRDPQTMKTLKDQSSNLRQQTDQDLQDYAPTIKDSKDQENYNRLKDLWQVVCAFEKPTIPMSLKK
jgi:CHASE3 domain sensor protein